MAQSAASKYADLANYVPDDVEQLDDAIRESLNCHTRDYRLKISSFKTDRLDCKGAGSQRDCQ